jgi:tRNA A-37 threonylcarbamoyl transferase component Bud32
VIKEYFVEKDNGNFFLAKEKADSPFFKTANFETVWNLQFEKTVKFVRKERATGFLHIEGFGKVYIKRGEFNLLKTFFNTLFKFTKQVSSLDGEAKAIMRLAELNIKTTPVIAFGSKTVFWKRRSFLVTQDVGDHPRLEHYFPQRFGNSSAGEDFKSRCAFIVSLASLLAKMHKGGVSHRDLYGCHIFVVETGSGWEFIILDLNRADVRKTVRTRWIVKDLSALAASVPSVSKADGLRFLKTYLGVSHLDENSRNLAHKIIKRIEKIKRRIRRSKEKDLHFISKHGGALPENKE